MHRILVADDNEDMCDLLSRSLTKRGFSVNCASDGVEALELLKGESFDVLLADLRMPNMDGIELLKKTGEISPQTLVIMITAYGTVEDAVEAMRHGAFDYVLKPFSSEEIEIKIRKALEHKKHEEERRLLRKEAGERLGGLIANSPAMQDISRTIDVFAPTLSMVLICGKSGTGKELIAREIHARSERADQQFISINCMAIDPIVQELELFGCERGAIEDIPEGCTGKIDAAEGGTIYIDEIAQLGAKAQERLLELIETGKFRRVGGEGLIPADVRIIGSTSEPLEDLTKDGRISDALYHKFGACHVELPELRDREEDIADLAMYYVDRYAADFHKHVRLAPETIGVLKNHSWPGNAHELENVIARAVIVCKNDVIFPSHLPSGIAGAMASVKSDAFKKQGVATQLDAIEREVINDALQKEGWNQSHAARRLGMKRTTLQYKLKKYGIKRP